VHISATFTQQAGRLADDEESYLSVVLIPEGCSVAKAAGVAHEEDHLKPQNSEDVA
jgi:hypothetical protein